MHVKLTPNTHATDRTIIILKYHKSNKCINHLKQYKKSQTDASSQCNTIAIIHRDHSYDTNRMSHHTSKGVCVIRPLEQAQDYSWCFLNVYNNFLFCACGIRTTLSTAARPNENQSYGSPSRILFSSFDFIERRRAIHSHVCLFKYQLLLLFFLAVSIRTSLFQPFMVCVCVRCRNFFFKCSFIFTYYIVSLTPIISNRTMHSKHIFKKRDHFMHDS